MLVIRSTLAPWLLCLGLVFPLVAVSEASGPVLGPVIENYGPVYEIPNAFGLDPGALNRAVMDVSASPDSHVALNRSIESAARFLNMSARSGVPVEHLKLAVVLHGSAGKDALSNRAYRARFGTDNPNDGLLNALAEAGVVFYLCGQTAGFRGYAADELHTRVQMATSAMSALTRLQIEGWALLP